jgi:hypothetical protein
LPGATRPSLARCRAPTNPHAFDLLELGGKDLRRTPLEERKRALAKLVRKASWAVQLNEHIAESGEIVFRHACKLGFVVSCRSASARSTSLDARGTGSRARLRPRRPSNEKQRKIGGGEPMLLILQEMIFAVLFAVSAVEAADVLVRLLTALGWQ